MNVESIHSMINEYYNIKWKSWQQYILNMLKNEPDDFIYVMIEKYGIGNVGKSFLCKYICMMGSIDNNDVIIDYGNCDYLFKQVIKSRKRNIVLIDIFRSSLEKFNKNKLYKINQIKNGSFKYKKKEYNFKSPHTIIFCHTLPNVIKKDKINKYKIIYIE